MEYNENIRKISRDMKGFSSCITVDEKCRRLKPHFETAKESDRAKMLFFLILNTDLSIKKKLEDVNVVGFLIGLCPSLSLSELSDIIVNLELVNTLADIVSTCPAVMSTEILNFLHGRILETENKFEYCRRLALALHDKYYKTFSSGNDDENDLLFNTFLMFLPSSYNSNGIELEEALLELNCQLQIWQECLSFRRISDNPAFHIDFRNACFVPNVTEVDIPVQKTGASLLKFIQDFRKFSELSGFLNCENNFPLQKTICENAYFLYETIKNKSLLEPVEEKWLKTIMKEPEPENLSEFDIDTLIINTSNNESDSKWFKGLINFPNWIEKEEALSCVMRHVDAMDLDDLKTVVECVKSVKCDFFDDKLQYLYLSCLERMPLTHQITYLNKHFEENRSFSWGTTDEELTEKFNKLSEADGSDEKIKSWLIATCIKSPSKTVTKLCKSALSNTSVLHRCVEYLKMLRGACLTKESDEQDLDIITTALKCLIENGNLSTTEKRFLASFIGELHREKILGFEFVNVCILNSIGEGLIAGNFEKVIFALELFKSSLKWKSVARSKDVVLTAFTVRVLSHASWDCSTFSMQLVHARELIISIAESLMKSSVNFNDLEKAWLRREILKSSEMNQMYFYDFLHSDDFSVIASKDLYIQLLALLHTKTEVHSTIDCIVTKFQSRKFLELRTSFNFALIKILPMLTPKEWTTLFVHLKSIVTAWFNTQNADPNPHPDLVVVDLLTVSMYCLAQDMNLYGDMATCFEFCVRNYGRVVRGNFLSEKMLGTDVRTDLAKKILFLMNGIQDSSSRKTNSMILSCVLLEITGNRSGNAAGDEQLLQDLEEWFKKDFIGQ